MDGKGENLALIILNQETISENFTVIRGFINSQMICSDMRLISLGQKTFVIKIPVARSSKPASSGS